MKVSAWYGIVLVALLCVSCATVGGMRKTRGEGVVKTFHHNYEQVIQATIDAAKLQKLELEEGGPDDYYLLLKQTANLRSDGELVAVFFAEKNDGVDVEIVSKRRFAIEFWAKNWTSSMFRAIEMELNGQRN